MAILNADTYKQVAYYWAIKGRDSDSAYSYLSEAITMLCRWEKKNLQYYDEKGNVNISRSIVYYNPDTFSTPGVNITIGGRIALQDESAPFEAGSSAHFKTSLTIKGLDRTPDLRNSMATYKAIL